ncbi:hypothetical protein BJX64DRAFT_297363 [Aspergillus heterothallicus]
MTSAQSRIPRTTRRKTQGSIAAGEVCQQRRRVWHIGGPVGFLYGTLIVGFFQQTASFLAYMTVITNIHGVESTNWQILLPGWNIVSMAWILGGLPAQYVFPDFTNNTGWHNPGIVFISLHNQITYTITGINATTHLADESGNPKRPIFLVLIINLSGGLKVATLVMLPLYPFCGAQSLNASSRLIGGLADKRCIPRSTAVGEINSTTHVPIRATMTSFVLTLSLGLLYIASDTVRNAVSSSVVSAYQASYIVPLALLLYQRRSDLPARYSNMGKSRVPYLGMNYTAMVLGVRVFAVLGYWASFRRGSLYVSE